MISESISKVNKHFNQSSKFKEKTAKVIMRIVVEGCAHGDLDRIYGVIQSMGKKVDLLICCGDFQSTRNLGDLQCMAVPPKYLDMCSFYK